MPSSFSGRGLVGRLDRAEARDELAPVLDEDRAQHVVLRREVVVEEPVRDARVLGDVADARAVVAAGRANTRIAASRISFRFSDGRLNRQSTRSRIEVRSAGVQPLAGTLVVDFTRYLPGAYASRELRGSALASSASSRRRAIRCARPRRPGTPRFARAASPSSATCQPTPASRGRSARGPTSCSRASGPESPRASASGPDDVPRRPSTARSPASATTSAIALRAGHDVNYLGWAGVLEDTAPAAAADPDRRSRRRRARRRDAGPRGAARARADRATAPRIVVSMTHRSHDLVAHRLGGEPVPALLTGGLACYRIYATADGRHLTVGALEPKFFQRLCELVGRPDLADRQYDEDQDALAAELAAIFAHAHARRLARALRRRGRLRRPGLDARGGRRRVRIDATRRADVPLGAHTDAWRRELGVRLGRAPPAARAACRSDRARRAADRRDRAGSRGSRARARPRCRPRTSRRPSPSRPARRRAPAARRRRSTRAA